MSLEAKYQLSKFGNGTFGHLDKCSGSNLSPSTNDGLRPLHLAALKGQLKVCIFLLENGAEKQPRGPFTN